MLNGSQNLTVQKAYLYYNKMRINKKQLSFVKNKVSKSLAILLYN